MGKELQKVGRIIQVLSPRAVRLVKVLPLGTCEESGMTQMPQLSLRCREVTLELRLIVLKCLKLAEE